MHTEIPFRIRVGNTPPNVGGGGRVGEIGEPILMSVRIRRV